MLRSRPYDVTSGATRPHIVSKVTINPSKYATVYAVYSQRLHAEVSFPGVEGSSLKNCLSRIWKSRAVESHR